MSIGYTWEKLSDAVLALACSDGTLQHRLARAYRAMDILTPDDFPDDELREAYARLVHAWRPGEPGDVEGTAAPALAACVQTRREPSLQSSCSCTPTSRGSRNNTTAPSLRAICRATNGRKARHARHPMTRKHCASHRESARW
jgi:hypothetical protein